MKNIIHESFDNTKLNCCLWDDVSNPKGVIQLIHGMASYAARMDSFAKILNQNGYIAFADDHRAHGATAGKDKLGIAEKDNFMSSVLDEVSITNMLIEKYKLPIQLFAHSYGSFLGQRYIELAGNMIKGVIFSGSGHMGGQKLILGKILTFIQSLIQGISTPNKLLHNMSYNSNNKPFLSENLPNAWLNRDSMQVKKYNDDNACGYVMSTGFYYSLMRGLSDIYKSDNLKLIRKDLPILLMSGAKDPVGGMGLKVKKLYDEYIKLGLNVDMKIYEDVRHELISDPDKDKMIEEMIKFYNSNI